MELWMRARIDGHFKQWFVDVVQQLLKAADHVVQLVNVTKQTETDIIRSNHH